MPRPTILVLVVLAALGLAACGGSSVKPAALGDPQAGQAVYATTCTACHGADAHGVPGLGKDLTTSAFLAEKSDDEALAFLLVGRPSSDPLNTTGVDMPPKGGNPALSENDLKNIIAYLRAIHQ